MPQITVEIDQTTFNKIEEIASLENVSVSTWISLKMESVFLTTYPKDFENLFGSIKDETFINPDDQQVSADQTPRN